MVKAVRFALAAGLLFASVTPASAVAVRSGATTIAIAGLTRGSAVSYDPVNHVYLVIGTYGVLQGPVPAVNARHTRTRSAAKDTLLNLLGRN